VARRIDIELTSERPDGTWTWRAAGAMQPRGLLDGKLLYSGAKAGDVARADADFELDGIQIVSVTAPKVKKRTEPERIELITPAASGPAVTTQLVGKGDRTSGRRGDWDRDSRPGRNDRQGPRRDGGATRPTRDGPGAGRPSRPADAGAAGDGAAGNGATGGRTPGRNPGDRPGGGRDGATRGPGERQTGPRDGSERRRPPATSGAGAADPRPQRGRSDRPRRPEGEDLAARSAARRLNPGNAHRQAVMASLSPEQQPIAEQVLRGGIPAVRTAIHLEREKATAEGRAAPNADSLLAIAEEVLPRLKAAEWRDRAEAAVKAGDLLALRDLRSVVAGADLARDDETRQLAASLRESLETRLTTMRQEWVDEITTQLDGGRVVRALRVASRAPEATTRLSAEQAERLAAAASAALSPETSPDLWLALLEAAAASPVRRSVVPAGLPPEPGAALLTAAKQQAGRIPALAGLLGISMPPPPGPIRPPGGTRPPPPGRGRPPRPGPRPQPGSAPKATAGSTGAPVADTPVADTPVAATPVAATPVADPPVAATPVADTPVANPPAADTPVADPPVADTPVTDAPASDAPAAEAPDAAVLAAPEMDVPAPAIIDVAPSVEVAPAAPAAPAATEPVAEVESTPTSEEPTVEEPTAEAPTAEEPTAEEPTAEEPAPEESGGEDGTGREHPPV
jgi:hypothetical protein